MARILLGVTGGIAAYKACDLVRLLVKAGHDVIPLVTPGAERFVRAETFTALARRPAGEDVYLHLTRADLLAVAPLTANTLARLAHGLADSVLTEAAPRTVPEFEDKLLPGLPIGVRSAPIRTTRIITKPLSRKEMREGPVDYHELSGRWARQLGR